MSTVISYIAALTFTLITTGAQAVFYDGNGLSEFCSASETESTYYIDEARCGGYIIGAADAIAQIEAYDDALCLPNNVTVGQVIKVVKKFMTDNPAELHRMGTQVVGFALFDAFPCE